MTEKHSSTALAEREAGHDGLGKALAVAGVGIAAAALLAPRATAQAAAPTKLTLYFTAAPNADATTVLVPGTGNAKVLNYALALETLEAELYRQAYIRLTGTSYDGSPTNDQLGNPIVGLGVAATEQDAEYMKTFGIVEMQHRDFLTTALNGNWVTTAGAGFDFNINSLSRTQVDELVYTAELTGTSAYLGAIPSFADKTYLNVAAGILGVEARHTSGLAAVIDKIAGTQVVETAPIVRYKGLNENGGRDTPLLPDQILYSGGSVPAGITVGGTGTINPVSGPNGFVIKLPTANPTG